MGLRDRLRAWATAELDKAATRGMNVADAMAAAAGRRAAEANTVSQGFAKSVLASVQGGWDSAQASRQDKPIVAMAHSIGIPVEWAKELEKNNPDRLMEMAALSKGSESSVGLTGGPIDPGKLKDWQAYDEDPLDATQAWGAWRERQSVLTYETLETMSRRIPPVAAIIQTRINQVAAYAEAQDSPHDTGFRIGLRDKDRKPGASDKKVFRELEAVILNCGFTPRLDEEEGRWRDGFEDFLRKLTRNRLCVDQVNIEKRRDVKGRPAEWRVIDAKTIRHVVYDWRGQNERSEIIRYAQVLHGSVVADFSALDLSFNVGNPRADIRAYRYGFSELEQMIGLATALLNGFDYNAKFFSQGTTTKGLLAIRGIVPPRQLRMFKRLWFSMVSGTLNAWRTPILNVTDEKGDVKWIDLQKSNLDMEWSAFMDWCLKLATAIWGISPSEINFSYGNTNQSSGLGSDDQTSKIVESKDKGLKPLLRFIAKVINENIIWLIDDKYEFQFVGMEARTQEEEADLVKKEITTYRTVDEIRKDKDLPPMKDGTGEVILDPTWLQWAQAQQMQQQDDGMGGGSQMDEGGLDFQSLTDGGGMMGGEGGDQNPFGGGGGGQNGPPPPNGPGQPDQPLARSQRNQRRDLRKARVTTYTVDL